MGPRARDAAVMARAIVLLGCMTLLTAWRFGPPLTYFDEEGAIARAVEALHAKVGFERILSIDITESDIRVEAQDPFNNRHVNMWTISKQHLGKLNWESTAGPEPTALNLVNPDLEANLFDLKDVDFAAAGALMKDAIERAALEDPGTVYWMEIRRQLYLLPKASSGDIRWSVRVRSGREEARVIADGKGRIVNLDLSATNRGRTFDLLKSLERLPEAAGAFAQGVGVEAVLLKARVASHGMSFETNLAQPAMFGSIKQTQSYTWNLNGLTRGMGNMDLSEHFGSAPPFSIKDTDWGLAPGLVAKAKDALQMPDGTLDEIEVEKPADQPGEPVVTWTVVLKDANGEEGKARFDAKGELLGAALPESRRKAFDGREPATWLDALAKLEATFGAGDFVEITLNDDRIRIIAADPQKPTELGQFFLEQTGFSRFGSASPFDQETARFRLAEIKGLTAEQLDRLKAATVARLGLPADKITSITIGRGSLDPSQQNNVTVEIRAEEAAFGRGGRVNWEIDGREIKAYLP